MAVFRPYIFKNPCIVVKTIVDGEKDKIITTAPIGSILIPPAGCGKELLEELKPILKKYFDENGGIVYF